MSFFEKGREIVAREKALNEAKRNAVEKVLGTHIKSLSVVQGARLVQDQILSQANGYIKDFKVLEEQMSDLGSYEVTIEAEVEKSFLVNDITRFEKIISLRNNPRIFVRIGNGLDPECRSLAERIKGLFTTRLQEDGFIVLHSPDFNSGAIPGLILGFGVKADSKTMDYQGVELRVNEVDISTSIMRPDDKVVLATASEVVSLGGDDRLKKFAMGAEKCVDKIWNALRKKLLTTWEKEVFGVRDITLSINKVDNYKKAQEFAAIIATNIRGVVEFKLLDFKGNTSAYAVKYEGKAKYFLNAMSMSYFQNKYFDFDVQECKANKLVLNIN